MVTELRDTTLKLVSEVFGLGAFEEEIREIIGNSNWEVLALRAREARAAFALAAEPSETAAGDALRWHIERIREEVTAGRKQNALSYLTCAFAELSAALRSTRPAGEGVKVKRDSNNDSSEVR